MNSQWVTRVYCPTRLIICRFKDESFAATDFNSNDNQTHSRQDINNESIQRAQTSTTANLVRIYSPDPDFRSRWLPKFNRDFLVQSYICDIIFMKIWSVFREIWAKLWKYALSRSVEESFRKFLDPDLEADDVKNLISLSTDTFVVKFSGRSVQWFLHKDANRQTDRQTDTNKRWALQSLLGGGKTSNHKTNT